MSPFCRRSWLQYNLRSLFLATLVVAVFCAGYALGERQGKRHQPSELRFGIDARSGALLTYPIKSPDVTGLPQPSTNNSSEHGSFFVNFMR